ncbi:MAG: hypothetical protein MJZ12_09670 [Prevotella sp.]|nr:hypothetical protein [Prevotella sp.]
MAKIIVQNTEITVSNVDGEDYICITDGNAYIIPIFLEDTSGRKLLG